MATHSFTERDISTVAFEWWRPLEERRYAEILALYNAVINEETILGYSESLNAEQGRAMLADLAHDIGTGRRRFFAIVDNDALVGMALVTPNRLPNCTHIAELSKGMIRRSHRGGGVLEAAMYELARRSLEQGHATFTLDVREHSRAHRIWASLGFQVYGRLEDYARVGGKSHAGVYMHIAIVDLLRHLGSKRKRFGRSSLQGDA